MAHRIPSHPATTTIDHRRVRRALIGATLLLAGYIALPTFRAVVQTLGGASGLSVYPKPSEIPSNEWVGAIGALALAVFGAGVLLLTVSLSSGAVARAIGVIGAGGYFLSAAGARAMYSVVAANLTETGADVGAQTAALWAVNIVGGGSLVLATSATAIWALLLGLHGPRSGSVGRPTAGVLLLCAALVLIGIVGMMVLATQFLFIPVGIALVLSLSLRMRETSADG